MFSILYRIAFVLLFTLAVVPQARADMETLDEIIADMDNWHKAKTYEAYIQSQDADPENITRILDAVENFERDSDKLNLYKFYLAQENIAPNAVAAILDDVANFEDDKNKLYLYKLYLAQENVVPENITKILDAVAGSNNLRFKAFAYAAYLTRKNTDPNIIRSILAAAGISTDANNKGIFHQAYDAVIWGLKAAVAIFKTRNTWNEFEKATIYAAYLLRGDADPDTISEILNTAANFRNESNKIIVNRTYSMRLIEDTYFTYEWEKVFSYLELDQVPAYQNYMANKDLNVDDIQTILTRTSRMSKPDRTKIYMAYFERENVDPDIMAIILANVSTFDIRDKALIYTAYMAQDDAEQKIMEGILRSASSWNAFHKAQLYTAYIARMDADPEIIEKMLTITSKYMDRHNKAQVYKAYMESPHVEQEQVLKIAKANLNSLSPQYSFFKMYLMDKHADQAHIGDALKNIKNFDEPAKTVFYLAYLAAKYAYAEDYSQFESDAVELAEYPSHLKSLLQDAEEFEKIQQVIKDHVAVANPADAIILWQMLPGLRQNRAVKRAR